MQRRPYSDRRRQHTLVRSAISLEKTDASQGIRSLATTRTAADVCPGTIGGSDAAAAHARRVRPLVDDLAAQGCDAFFGGNEYPFE